MSKVIKSVELLCQGSGRDAEYKMQIIVDGGEYLVNFEYGRRGSTLRPGTKTKIPVTLDKANKIFEGVLKEKTSENPPYVIQAAENIGDPLVMASETSASGEAPIIIVPTRKFGSVVEPAVIPQLPNPIEDEALEGYLLDDRYGASEKKDGKSLMFHKAPGSVRVTNKKGKDCGYPKEFEQGLVNVDQAVANGEGIGQILYLYDLLEINGEDLRSLGYLKRFERLSQLDLRPGCVIVPVAVGVAEKRALYNKLVAEKREGIIFKLLDEPYTPGKTGSMAKKKFYATLSARVAKGREGKRSVGLELLDDKGVWVAVGNVTIPPNHGVPKVLDVVEIRYLYAYKGGSLYQPTYLGLRDDIDAEECLVAQCKYKPESEDEES